MSKPQPWMCIVPRESADRIGVETDAVGTVHEIPEDRVHDPREEAEWFCRLPEHAREEYRDRWRVQEVGTQKVQETRRQTTTRYVVEGTAITVFCAILIGPGFWTLILAPLVGGAMGAVARALRLLRFGYGALAAIVYPLFFVVPLTAAGAFQLFHGVIFVTLFAMAGAMHELQRFDSSEI